jgi:hypothetical protein
MKNGTAIRVYFVMKLKNDRNTVPGVSIAEPDPDLPPPPVVPRAPGARLLPLARAYDPEQEVYQVTVWTNRYGNARVFGTTIGHHTETMESPVYLDLVTRGLLWAAGRLEGGTP